MMDKIIAGYTLMQSVADADDYFDDDEATAVNEWLNYNVGIGGALLLPPSTLPAQAQRAAGLTTRGGHRREYKILEARAQRQGHQ